MGILSFLGFTLLVAVIAYISTLKTDENSSDGYFLGGRSLGGFVIAGSLLLTNLSTEQIVGLNGQSFAQGILVMAWETIAAIAMVITAIFLLPRYLKGGLTTIPQFLEKRYDRSTKAITSGLFLSGYAIILLPIVLYTGSLALSSMFDIPELLGVSKFWSIVICVVGIGIVGSIYAIFGGLKAVAVSDTINAIGLLIGGLMIPVFGLLEIGDGSMSQGLSTLLADHPDKFKSLGSKESFVPWETLFTGMLLVNLFYWGTNQAIVQRALGAKNLKEGQKGMVLAAFIKILGPLMVVLPGIIAFHMFGNTLDTPDEAYPRLVKKASEKQTVKAGKRFGILLALFAVIIAPFLQYASSIFDYLQKANGCYSIPILTIIVVGYLNKKVPSFGAKIGMITGIVLYFIYLVFDLAILEDGFPLHFLHVMAIIFVITTILMIIIGKIRPREVDFELEYTKDVDITPWKNVKIWGALICITVIGIYIYFA